MATFAQLEAIATSLDGVTTQAHFDRIAFKVKKIFATYDEKTNTANVKLSIEDQENYSSSTEAIYPVNNKWGTHGWTTVELEGVDEITLSAVIRAAYNEVK